MSSLYFNKHYYYALAIKIILQPLDTLPTMIILQPSDTLAVKIILQPLDTLAIKIILQPSDTLAIKIMRKIIENIYKYVDEVWLKLINNSLKVIVKIKTKER